MGRFHYFEVGTNGEFVASVEKHSCIFQLVLGTDLGYENTVKQYAVLTQ